MCIYIHIYIYIYIYIYNDLYSLFSSHCVVLLKVCPSFAAMVDRLVDRLHIYDRRDCCVAVWKIYSIFEDEISGQ